MKLQIAGSTMASLPNEGSARASKFSRLKSGHITVIEGWRDRTKSSLGFEVPLFFGGSLFRISAWIVTPPIMCFDLWLVGEPRPFLLNQPTGISELWEAKGLHSGTLISIFSGALLYRYGPRLNILSGT